VRFSGAQRGSATPARATPRNDMKLSSYNTEKTRGRDLKAAATIYSKKQAEAAKAVRQQAAEERREAKKARAADLAAQRALKKQQRDAATSQKSHNTSNNGKRKASHKSDQNPIKRRRCVAAESQLEACPAVASPPPKLACADAKSRHQRDPNRQKVSPTPIDQYTRGSHDNSFCVWLYSFIFLSSITWWGGTPADGYALSCTASAAPASACAAQPAQQPCRTETPSQTLS
jgi:hypothetical protein